MTSAEVTAPIGEYGLIGDTRTAALVSAAGSIDWLCLPRFDSAPVFGRLVGGDEAGRFVLSPEGAAEPVRRRYRGETTTLETEWRLNGARLLLADSMVAEVAGRMLPATLLVRRLTAEAGPVAVRLRLSPRFGYRREVARRVRRHDNGLVIEHGDLAIAVASDAPIDLETERDLTFPVEPGRPLTVSMSVAHRSPLIFVPAATAADSADQDEARWRLWASEIDVPGHHRDPVVRSLITLRLLTYSPSGAPVAAPTTSLPEEVGGSRNWDYRYSWPRDASIGIAAFLAAGKHREAVHFMAWLRHASRLARPRLPALFTLDGRPAPAERELDDWPGYAGSRPVRVGNGARSQHQLDGYGWVADAAWRLCRAGHRLDGETWRATASYADYVARHWHEPDAGIWERRDQPRHHVHSKLMGWLTLDRSLRIAQSRGDGERAARWSAARRALGGDILRRGFDTGVGAYTAYYGTKELDAAVLLLPTIGLEPPDSPRIIGTIEAIRTELGAGGPLVFRYTGSDGLAGGEGAFLPCSFWLVQALALVGRRAEAEELFAELLALAGPLGLYAEELDPRTHDHLGNFPQALTHAALLQAASALAT